MVEKLTKREAEVLALIAQGHTTAEIAVRLIVSTGTVKAHSHNIYSKLGVSNRTQALVKAQELGLLVADVAPDKAGAEPSRSEPATTARMPTQLTTFVGRKAELAQLADMVGDPRIRLITLLGPGGMGKTRVAVELARACADHFDDGACFVALARISAVDQIAAAIIDDLGLRFERGATPDAQLLDYLADRHLLLVLDNFEHILDATPFLARLLEAAPRVKLLVTSRERLNLSVEVLYVLGGLEFGRGLSAEEARHADAVRLLLERSRFVQPAFSPQTADWEQMQRIGRLTAGMPLALILAAGWLDLLSLREVADELEKGIDILDSELRDLPARQRSMRSTILASWQRLTRREQQVFAELSIFRGGFTREAAESVTGASLRDLQKLVNRSFVSVRDGRYEIHELLRQFAEGELRKNEGAADAVCMRHSNYFTHLLAAQYRPLLAAERTETVLELTADLDNFRTAWRFAVEQADLDALLRSVMTLVHVFHTQSRFLEAIDTCEVAITRLRALPVANRRDLLLAILLNDLAFFNLRPGHIDRAEALFHESYALLERIEFRNTYDVTDPLIGLGLVASIRGNYTLAEGLLEQTLARPFSLDNLVSEGYARYILSGIALAQGNVEEAAAQAERGMAVAERANDRWLRSHCLMELGHACAVLGDVGAAEQHFRACYEIRRVFDDRQGMAAALTQLGRLALQRNMADYGRDLFREALAIYQRTHDRGGLATVVHGLARVALLQGDLADCRQRLGQAVQIAHEIQYMLLLFDALVTAAEIAHHDGRPASARRLLDYAVAHPSCTQETRSRALSILATVELSAVESAPIAGGDTDVTLDAVVAAVLAQLASD